MTPRFTTLRTTSQYSLARVRVLCRTRTLWSALMVSLLLMLAVIGTSAAWRARTGGEQPPLAEATFAVSPLAELVPQTTAVPAPQEVTAASSALPATQETTVTDTSIVTQSAETRDPLTTTRGGARVQSASCQQVHAPQRAVMTQEHARAIVALPKVSARVERETETRPSPSRPASRAPVPALPRVQVVSVSSTAVLIQHRGRRQIVRRGARLNGWTFARLAPTGVTLQRAQHQALLPLSFDARVSSMR
jgi:hypothetical protein